MTEAKIYHDRVAALEKVVSYGILGVVDLIARRLDDPAHLKRNLLIVNGGTVVRNCYVAGKSDKEIMSMIKLDFEQLRYAFEMYAQTPSTMLVYFPNDISQLIPEFARRKQTPSRVELERLTRLIGSSEGLTDKLKKLSVSDNVTYYGIMTSRAFAYRKIIEIVKSTARTNAQRIWLVSHCPIDYFILDEFRDAEVILSHTGRTLTRNELSGKVFKEPTLPFTRMTYKLFGDSEYIKGALKNRPKAIQLLEGTKLRLKTESEIAVIAKTKLGVDPKMLSWTL